MNKPALITLTDAIDLIEARTGYRFTRLNLVRQSRAGGFPDFAKASKKAEPVFRLDDVKAWIDITFKPVLRQDGSAHDASAEVPAIRVNKSRCRGRRSAEK